MIFSYVAVVSDTDGSAFITKAEFDSLKNNFQAQIDNYNSSIDSKIDGAIASYLAGVKISQIIVKSTLYPIVVNMPDPDDLRYEWNGINFKYLNAVDVKSRDLKPLNSGTAITNIIWCKMSQSEANYQYHWEPVVANVSSTHNTAQWVSYSKRATTVTGAGRSIDLNTTGGFSEDKNDSLVCWTIGDINLSATGDDTLFSISQSVSSTWQRTGVTPYQYRILTSVGYVHVAADSINAQKEKIVDKDLGKWILWEAVDNNCFVCDDYLNKNPTYVIPNWGIERPRLDIGKYIDNIKAGKFILDYYNMDAKDKAVAFDIDINNTTHSGVTIGPYDAYGSVYPPAGHPLNLIYVMNPGGTSVASVEEPHALDWGLVDTLTNWNQIYTTDFDDVANDTEFVGTEYLNDESNKKHLKLTAGVPLFNISLSEINSMSELKIKFDNLPAGITYKVCVADRPFGDEFTNTGTKLQGYKGSTDLGTEWTIQKGDEVKINPTTAGYYYIKFCKEGADPTCDGFVIPNQYTIVAE